MENKHYEPLYSLNSFLKFERKLYQFVGIPFGRPIKVKTAVYFFVIFVLIIAWRFIPIINLPIKWIPPVVLLVIAGAIAWLLSDVGTEARNPTKYFRSVFQYQQRKLKKVMYYRGKEIKKLTDYDVSGHIQFSIPQNHLETNSRLLQLEKNCEFIKNDIEQEELPLYESVQFDFKPFSARMSDFSAEDTLGLDNEETLEKTNEYEGLNTFEVKPEMLMTKEIINPTIQLESNSEVISDSAVVVNEEKPTNIIYYPVLVNLEDTLTQQNNYDETKMISDSTITHTLTEEPQADKTHFKDKEKIRLTPTVRMNHVESVEKIKELEEKVMYLKIGDIKKMVQSENSNISKEEKVSFIAKYIEKTFEAIERRKQMKRFKARQKKK